MRRNEILNLTRHSIDWQNRLVTLEDTKNGETRHVPLNDTAVEVLRSLPARFDGRLFPFKDGHSVSRAFPALSNARESPISGYMTASHTFASYHAMAGVQGREPAESARTQGPPNDPPLQSSVRCVSADCG
jgi:integrase